MPRKPTSDVTGLRIDLGTKERQLLESFAISYRIDAFSRTTSALVSNPANILILYQSLGIIYERITGKDLPFIISSTEDGAEAIAQFLKDLRDEFKKNRDEGIDRNTLFNLEIEQLFAILSQSIFGGIAEDFKRESEKEKNPDLESANPFKGVDLF